METIKTYNWGILGAGKIAGKFVEDLQKVPGANIYAVASRSLDRATEFASENNVSKSYGNYLELVKDKEVDIIYIATPHVFHFDHTMLALEHKKAVLCEKPFAMNREQVIAMIAKAKKENVFLMEALWTYFLPHYQFVLKLTASKKYGELKELKADFGFEAPYDTQKRIFNKELGGGSLLDVGIYPVFAAFTILGIPDEIIAHAQIGETGVDENCDIQFKYKNGAIANLKSSIKETTPTEAIIKFENAEVIIHSRFHQPSSLTIITKEGKKTINFEVDTHGYNFEAIHVQQMLSENKTESTIMSFERSLALIDLLDIIRGKIGLKY